MNKQPVTIHLQSDGLTLKQGRTVTGRSPVVPPVVRPFLKWAGGKQWLSPAAPYMVPRNFAGRYFEPFLGAGAFYFALEPAHATLSDINPDLILTYRVIAEALPSLMKLLKSYRNERAFYEDIRACQPKTSVERAARFIYLNRTCWNGLYRVNQRGQFNTPFGCYKNPTICDEERLHKASQLIKRARLACEDFEKAVANAKRGDFVYFDPPYITKHIHNGFLKYNASLFSWDDQVRLSEVARKLSRKGVAVLLSNATHESVRRLYEGFYTCRLVRRSLIAGDNDQRGWVQECLLSNYKLTISEGSDNNGEDRF